jgi:hypothetical protein
MSIYANGDSRHRKHIISLLICILGNQQSLLPLDINKPKNILAASIIGMSASAALIAASYRHYRSFLNQKDRHGTAQKDMKKVEEEKKKLNVEIERIKKSKQEIESKREAINEGDISGFDPSADYDTRMQACMEPPKTRRKDEEYMEKFQKFKTFFDNFGPKGDDKQEIKREEQQMWNLRRRYNGKKERKFNLVNRPMFDAIINARQMQKVIDENNLTHIIIPN